MDSQSAPVRLEPAKLSRRRCLQAGLLSIGGLGLAELFRLRALGQSEAAAEAAPEAANSSAARTRSDASPGGKISDPAVILLFVHGGPSHLETYDMKPAASAEIRGPFQPIATNVSGIEVCEHLPKHAKIADRFTLIRSCCHDEADHFAGHRRFLSGYGKLKPGFGYESYYPQVGAVANRLLQGRRRGILPAVSVGGVVVNGPDYAAGVSEGYWSSVYRVPIVNGGLRDASLNVDPRRLEDRLALQQGFDRLRRTAERSEMMDAMDEFQRRAYEVLTTGKAQEAFDLSREPEAVRDAYGDGWGRDALVARRLVEAGVSFVTLRSPGGGPNSMAHDWDDHAVNWDMRNAMLARLPQYDQVVTTLIEDLYRRGLDRRVLLVVTGEFGRTPRLEFKDGRIGRDHWPGAMSILMSGGGIRTGQIIGATDHMGAQPSRDRFDPHDLLATIYRHLGIDHKLHIPDPSGRPIALTNGRPIDALYRG